MPAIPPIPLRATMLLLTGTAISFLLNLYGPLMWMVPSRTPVFLIYPLIWMTFPIFAPFGIWVVQKSTVQPGLDHSGG